MALPQCPECHAVTKPAGNQRYCPSCGWNRDAAIASLRGSLKLMPVGVLMFAGFVGFMVRGWHFRNPIQIAIFAGVPAFGILVNYIYARKNLATLEAMPAPAVRPRAASDNFSPGGIASGAGVDADLTPSPEASAQYQALMRTSCPRQIRMSSGGKFGIVAALLMSVGFAAVIGMQLYTKWALRQSFAKFQSGDWFMGAFGALLLLLPYGIWRGQNTECDLLENGEVALAKVTRQWTGDKNSSSIECEFKDFSGQVHKVIATDNTRKLYESMSVPVFYDRDNPKRQVAYCSTLHEVVT
ncbi:MAG TPA: hypothetical protein VEX69_09055 [Candidatus Limnocylindria bacterium]|nr:hypothetical protein [Candidatus Limnocylindria bacterium]